MGYSSGFLDSRIIVKRKVEKEGGMGRNSFKYAYEDVCSLWASVKGIKGMKAMHEGALDSYDTVMIRTRWTEDVTRDKFIEHEGALYQIQNLHGDKHANEIQIIAVEMKTQIK